MKELNYSQIARKTLEKYRARKLDRHIDRLPSDQIYALMEALVQEINKANGF